MDSIPIQVDTVDGVVTLRGKVNTDFEKAVAKEIADDVLGVKRVGNQLVVEGDDRVSRDDPPQTLTLPNPI